VDVELLLTWSDCVETQTFNVNDINPFLEYCEVATIQLLWMSHTSKQSYQLFPEPTANTTLQEIIERLRCCGFVKTNSIKLDGCTSLCGDYEVASSLCEEKRNMERVIFRSWKHLRYLRKWGVGLYRALSRAICLFLRFRSVSARPERLMITTKICRPAVAGWSIGLLSLWSWKSEMMRWFSP
jgi:hypothetical protein